MFASMSNSWQRKATLDTLLDPIEIERLGGPTVGTQRVWRAENRHGWRDVNTFIGKKAKVSKRRYKRWLEEHSGTPKRAPARALRCSTILSASA